MESESNFESPEVEQPLSVGQLLDLFESGVPGELRTAFVDQIQNEQDFKEAAIAFRTAAVAIVDQQKGEQFRKAQIALTIEMGRIWQEAGKQEYADEEFADARMCAEQEGFDDILGFLQSTNE